jgi:fatty acid desaturase
VSAQFRSSLKFSVHQLVLDLRHHCAWVYWVDLLISANVFWLCVAVSGFAHLSWVVFLLLICVGSLALYRAALFVHEIGHFSRGTLPGFEAVWNVLIGWPMLFPSFFIQSHADHHRMASFGTANDPEYLPFSAAPRKMRTWFVVGSALTPFILLLRATLVVPVSWVWPPVRRWLRAHASRMTMNNAYQPSLKALQLSVWHEVSEVIATLFVWGWIVGVSLQVLPWEFPVSVFVCMTLANLLNGWRTLHAHAYTSVGVATDFLGQLQDSTTFQLPAWLGELVAPVGQRFHAAHHLFPYLPYHALAEADRRIKASNWEGKDAYLKTQRLANSPKFQAK